METGGDTGPGSNAEDEVRRHSPNARAIARAGLIFSLLECVVIRLPYLRLVPIWDSRQYWDACVGPALQKAFDPLAFNCFGHRTVLYMLSVGWPQYFDYGSVLLLNLALLAIALLTVAAFYRVVTLLFEPSVNAETGILPAALTIIFASMPVWTAGSVMLNPDSGVLLGFLLSLALLLDGRRKTAVLAGLYLVLSKEIGLLLWILLAVTETLAAWITTRSRQEWRSMIIGRWSFLLPPLGYFATGMALRAASRPDVWVAPSVYKPGKSLLQIFLTFDLGAGHFGAYIADLFVLNFSWIMTLVIAGWLCTIVIAIVRQRSQNLNVALQSYRTLFVVLLTPLVLYVITRYPTFNNARYLLPAIPLIVIAFGAAVVSLVARRRNQVALLGLVFVTQVLSMWQTTDPLSRFLFGTWNFGTNPMLAMTSPTNECCGYGRDQLIYNLQFTHFATIQDAVFQRVHATEKTVFAMAPNADWHLQGQIQEKTLKRTLRTTDVIVTPPITMARLARGASVPATMFYIAYPNVDNEYDLKLYSYFYEIAPPIFVDDGNGYELPVFEMRRNKRPTPRFTRGQS